MRPRKSRREGVCVRTCASRGRGRSGTPLTQKTRLTAAWTHQGGRKLAKHPQTCALPQVAHIHERACTRVSFSTPSPWGRGPSNTDVVLINWAQRREVGLETTWQFPAACPPPLPPLHLHTPSSSSNLDHVSQQVGCWEERLPCGVDILPASSSLGALHCRHSLWQCLLWLWAESWKRCESDRLCGCTCRYTCREGTALQCTAEHIIERGELKGRGLQKRGDGGTDGRTVFSSHFFSKACGLPSEAQAGFLMKAQEGGSSWWHVFEPGG